MADELVSIGNDGLGNAQEELPTTDVPINNLPIANFNLAKEWKVHYLKEHTISSTNSYFSFIKRYAVYDTVINQKTVNKFRENNRSGVCSGALKSFFKFLVDKKDFSQDILNIRFDRNKSTKKTPESITPQEIDKIVIAMTSLMDKNLTLTIYMLGLRISEALKLTWQDFDWLVWLQDRNQLGHVTIRNSKRGKTRTIPVSPELMNRLYEDHKNNASNGLPIGNLVFDIKGEDGTHGIEYYLKNKNKPEEEQARFNYINYAENYYRRLLYKVSLSVLGKRINPHRLRHAKALNMLNNDVPLITIKEYLGHAKVTSTEVYFEASGHRMDKDIDNYEKKVEGDKNVQH